MVEAVRRSSKKSKVFFCEDVEPQGRIITAGPHFLHGSEGPVVRSKGKPKIIII